MVWPFFGYDEVNYTTTPEARALLARLVQTTAAPVRVRNHFLLNSGDGSPALKWGSTNVYTEDTDGNPVYDFSLTDPILDTLVQAGASPLVELGFMPEALSTHPKPYQNTNTILLNGGCFYPPNDHAKWAALVSTWATHVSGRYGERAPNWLWELWNEPDSNYWHGSVDDYAKLYDYTEAALHGALPGAQLGGPAVIAPDGPFLTQFLEHCATGQNALTGSSGTRLDLVSFHAKGGVAVKDGHVELDLGNQLRLHRAGFRAVAGVSRFAATPIYITEADPDGCAACTAELLTGTEYRTSPAYGAYELAMMKRSLELEAEVGVKLGGVLTWAFTFPGMPYFAGYRELSSGGISLPVLGAFELLGSLSGARLPLMSSGALSLDEVVTSGVRGEPDIDGMAALDADTVRVLLWNYHDQLVTAEPTKLRLRVRVPPSFGSKIRVAHQRVDEQHGDAYAVWITQGRPQPPTTEQLAALQQAMEPASLSLESSVADAVDGSISLDFDLPRFAVSLLTLTPAAK